MFVHAAARGCFDGAGGVGRGCGEEAVGPSRQFLCGRDLPSVRVGCVLSSGTKTIVRGIYEGTRTSRESRNNGDRFGNRKADLCLIAV